ncbi:hypothetical protein GCM10010472_34910 [Pseudonocardia halophobica]|uniref:Uncharacterized protein n=1 Tax=Pseudonocardia halophobica TaxID=29401 RepID=A0A9W6NW92_9PSEU|nr:hypothetical protein [Pseudonocardia halophobica]GLL12130.1 hypothetical protein GCM10017577_32710 [Pseudonocardia halophobica]
MSTQPGPSPSPKPPGITVDDLFAAAAPIRTGDDLAHDGVFDDDELDAFLTDLQKMRRSDIA